MERILAMDAKQSLKLMSVTFSDNGYATLGTGKPLYRVYNQYTMTYETGNLLDAYMMFVHLGNFLPKPLLPGNILMVSNARSRQPKVFGLFESPVSCTQTLFASLPLFMKKNGNQELAGVNLLEHFYRNTPLDKALLPYLNLELVRCNRLIPK